MAGPNVSIIQRFHCIVSTIQGSDEVTLKVMVEEVARDTCTVDFKDHQLELLFQTRYIPYSRKISRVKTFANFAVLSASAKVLSTNFSARGLGERVGFSKTRKFYSQNALLYRIRESFHPRTFPARR